MLQATMKNWIQKHYFISVGILILVGWLSFILVGASSGTCSKCKKISTNVINLTIEELNSCPQKYENKIIRMAAILHHDSGQLFLGDEGFNTRNIYVPAGRGEDFVSCYFTQRAITFNTGYRTWYDGSAHITMFGKFGIIDDQMRFHSGITGVTLLCIEAVTPANSWSAPINNYRYALARTSRLIFRLSLEP